MVVLRRGSGALLCMLSAWLLPSLVVAKIVNRTIDDSFGDSQTGLKVTYLPVGNWHDQSCLGCSIRPDVTQAFNGTYTAATYLQSLGSINITMRFNGTAIYVFFILFNNEGPQITTLTLANFILDGNQPQLFINTPDMTISTVEFNQLVFSQTNLTNAQHTLVIAASGVNEHIYVNFDYAIYTHDDDAPLLPLGDPIPPIHTSTNSTIPTDPVAPRITVTATSIVSTSTSALPSGSNTKSKSSTAGLIVGGGVSAIALIFFSIYFARRFQKKKKSKVEEGDGTFVPSSTLQLEPDRARQAMVSVNHRTEMYSRPGEGGEAVEEEMSVSNMREQLRLLRGENAYLQDQQRSARAQTLCEAPPSYSTAIAHLEGCL